MPLIDLTRDEIEAIKSFIEDYAPDTNLNEDWDFDKEKIDALNSGYDKFANLTIGWTHHA